MVPRERHLRRLFDLLALFPVVAILGARQVGKTTLARQLSDRWSGPATRFDLEDEDHLARLAEPRLALQDLAGLVVIDEVQRRPDLFPTLRVLVDRPGATARFLLLGSASPDLLRQGAESLAGRISFHELPGFTLDEAGPVRARALWMRGGFPPSFLAPSDPASAEWRRSFVQTFLERDLPQLGVRLPAPTLRRFWQMIAHCHGQVLNAAELSRAFGVGGGTVRRYLDTLEGALVVRSLPPWHENISKRQVKSPKVYVADSGLLHSLLGIETPEDLDSHPKVGASFEGFALAETVARLGARPEECFFWATHAGAELDLFVRRGSRRLGFEFKRTTAPRTTHSMHAAMESLSLDRLTVVHAGTESFPLTERITAVALGRVLADIAPLPCRPGPSRRPTAPGPELSRNEAEPPPDRSATES